MQETIQDIAASIKEHRLAEEKEHVRIRAIARVNCDMSNTFHPQFNGNKCLWLTNNEYRDRIVRTNDGRRFGGSLGNNGKEVTVYKNTKIGEVIIKNNSGFHNVPIKSKYLGINNVSIDIFNKTSYNCTSNSARDLTVYLNGDSHGYHFKNLSDLYNELALRHNAYIDKKRKIDEERKAREEAARKAEKEQELAREKLAREEAERQRKLAEEAERKRLEEEKRRQEEEQAELDRLAQKEAEAREKIWNAQLFIREGNSLRSQHVLDPVQEDVKRSHLYDGVPVLIEGGPGTGKTTTLIQRLKFLISYSALTDYDTPLTETQINELTDPQTVNSHWLFFSPNNQLLGFLRDAMREEDLRAEQENTTVLEKFCKSQLLNYKLRNQETDGPFRYYQFHGETAIPVIKDAMLAVDHFRKFIVRNIVNILQNAYKLPTSQFEWNSLAIEIKAYCKRGDNVKDLDALVRLFNSMMDNEKAKVNTKEKELSDLLKRKALQVKNAVEANEPMKQQVNALFEKWIQETVLTQDDSVDENDMDEAEDEDNTSAASTQFDFDTKLFQQIQPILRKLGLKRYDSKQKLSTHQSDLYDIIKEYVDPVNLDTISSLAWFSKKYAFLCRGIQSNIFNQIPRLYKLFRKEEILKNSKAFDVKLLEKISNKQNGKYLHQEEIELIIGVINHMLLAIYKKSKLRFESMKNNKYVKAYMENVKPVIGVDEATDFSMIDYYFISSFLHYEYSSLTLCGDIMQSMNSDGIKSWDELKSSLFPNMVKYELSTSYRQVPTLLDMSKRIYHDSLGAEAPYDTTYERVPQEPAPIYYVSDDLEDKVRWIEKRIIEVLKSYGDVVPSIAIMVGDSVDISELCNAMYEEDLLNGIDICDCSGYKNHDSVNAVRIFPLSEVKGMEFEVAFFYDIDEALAGQSLEMMRRYLYVGISRATTHLAATFTKKEGNEDIIKYFDANKHNWK